MEEQSNKNYKHIGTKQIETENLILRRFTMDDTFSHGEASFMGGIKWQHGLVI